MEKGDGISSNQPKVIVANDIGNSSLQSKQEATREKGRRNRGRAKQSRGESNPNSTKTKKVEREFEMEKDAEMRRLNAKLREQEYR